MVVLGWAVTVGLLALTATQWVGFDQWRPVAVLQAMAPYLMIVTAPVGVVALVAREPWMAAAAVPTLVTLGWLVLPAVRNRRAPGSGEPSVSVFFGNLLAWNPAPHAVAATVAATGADVLVLTEFNHDMRAELARLCPGRYPHRLEDVRPDPAGIAVWSELPMEAHLVPLSDRPTIDTVIDVHGVSLRIIGLHTEPPTMHARVWSRELRDIGDLADDERGAMPTAIVGDFNAARWHPSFRRLLRRGWSTAHEWLGVPWSNSWAQQGRGFPLFVRIDHALLRGDVAPVSVVEVPLPGSDHVGFVVRLAVGTR